MTWAVFLAVLGCAGGRGGGLAARAAPDRPSTSSGSVGSDADAPSPSPARHLAGGPGFAPQAARLPDGPGRHRARLARGPDRRARPRDRALRGEAPPGPPAPTAPASAHRPTAVTGPRPPASPGGRTSRPLDRVRQPAATRPRLPDAPCRLRRSDLWAPLAYLLLALLGARRPARRTAHRLPLAGGAGPAGVRVVLRRRRPQPDLACPTPCSSDLQNFPGRREPDGQRRGAGPGHPPRPADPARRALGDLPRRRAARAGRSRPPRGSGCSGGTWPCTRWPPPSVPASWGSRRAWCRTPTGIRTSSRSSSCRVIVDRVLRLARGPPPGARRRRARPPRRLAGPDRRGGAAAHRRGPGHRRPRLRRPRAGPPAADAARPRRGAGVCLALVAVPLWWQFAGPQSYGDIWHPPGATTSPSCGGAPPAASVPTRGPRPRCR